MVDVGDLGILAANYGTTDRASWSLGDFNGDSAVDVGDLGILAANYGTGNFAADYARAFGTTVEEENTESDLTSGNLFCNSLGLPLILGLLSAVMILIVKAEE